MDVSLIRFPMIREGKGFVRTFCLLFAMILMSHLDIVIVSSTLQIVNIRHDQVSFVELGDFRTIDRRHKPSYRTSVFCNLSRECFLYEYKDFCFSFEMEDRKGVINQRSTINKSISKSLLDKSSIVVRRVISADVLHQSYNNQFLADIS